MSWWKVGGGVVGNECGMERGMGRECEWMTVGKNSVESP